MSPKRRVSRRSLLVRLTTMFMMVAILSVGITLAVLSVYQVNMVNHAENRRLNSLAQILTPNITASLLFEDIDTTHELIDPLTLQPSILEVQVLGNKGNVFASIGIGLNQEDLDKGNITKIESLLEVDDIPYGTLVIYADNGAVEKHVSFYIGFLMITFVVIIIFGFIISLRASRKFVKPILQLAEIANRVTYSNDYSLRAVNDSQDEIGDLTKGFNLMLETIEQRDQVLESTVQERTGELKRVNKELRNQAYRDSLSGLPNRRYIYELINERINNSFEPCEFGLFFLDLDGFKEVNDTLGHDYGDALIIAAAKRIEKVISKRDTLARLGGDEFTVFVDGTSDHEILTKIANRIGSELNNFFSIRDEKIHITASIGVSTFPECGATAEIIMKKADLAMYDAKASGRNCHRYYQDSMLEKLQNKKRVIDDLRVAIKNNELELYFQPIIDLSSRQVVKAEALIRWNHPGKGLIMPQDFIPIAEENGLINELGNWVVNSAIESVRRFRKTIHPDFCVNINVSPAQLKPGEHWLSHFIYCLKNADLGEHALSIEITETALMTNEKSVINELMSLKGMGVEIAIDDFGVGYSSLSYLQQLKIDTIKIDKSFVQQLDVDLASATLCRTMVQMAKNLDIKVVAEGIENAEHLDLLTIYGCHFGQGYYFSKPVRYDDFEDYLRSYKPKKPAQ